MAFAFIFIFFLFGLLTDINVRFGFLQRMAAVVSVYFVMELVFKVYRGTIRYSGLSEAVRLFFYVVISMGVTIPVMIYLGKLSPVMKISNVWLLVHGATTFFIMFGLRILIRYAYYFLTTVPNKMKRVFVYGSDPNSITMAQMLTSDVASLYKPVAILDSEVSFKGMRLGSVPILKMANDFNGLIKLIATSRVEKIIFN